MKLYWPSLFVVLCACGSSDSGDSGGSTGGSGDSTGATAATMTATATVSDTLGTMSDSMSGSMSASMTDTMTTGMTTDATETTVADSSGSADSGSSGQADSGSTGQGSDSGSTGGAGGVYDQCVEGDPPCAEGQVCVDIQGDNFCTIPCDTADDCPAPSSGDATVDCGGPPMGETRCQLTCSDGETCPDGMDCVMLGGGGFALCLWPG